MKKETKEFWKHFLVTATIMSLCFILFDLWDPIERMITEHFETRTNLTSYISLKKDIPVILAVSVLLARASVCRKKATDK